MKDYLVKNLKVKDYGVFNLYRGQNLIPESDIPMLLIDAVADLPAVQRVAQQNDYDWLAIEAYYSPDHEDLLFDIGGEAEIPMSDILASQGIQVTKPRKVTSQAAARITERQAALREKLQTIPETPKETYLLHANQCGYLLAHTTMTFGRPPQAYAAYVKTFTRNMTLELLQSFVDATGGFPMSGLDDRFNPREKTENNSTTLTGTFKEFAYALVDFLNLEFIIDIDELMSTYKNLPGEYPSRSFEEWGGSREVVLQRLIERRPGMNAEIVAEYFDAGYNGELV